MIFAFVNISQLQKLNKYALFTELITYILLTEFRSKKGSNRFSRKNLLKCF